MPIQNPIHFSLIFERAWYEQGRVLERFSREAIYHSRGPAGRPVCAGNPSAFLCRLERPVTDRNHDQDTEATAADRSSLFALRYVDSLAEVERQLVAVLAASFKAVVNDPVALPLVEADHAAVRNRLRKPSITVMLRVEPVEIRIALPRVDSRADIGAEREIPA